KGRKKGGDYLWAVKDNQPELKEAIAAAFDPPAGHTACTAYERRVLSAHRQTASASDKGHGRREHRKLTASTELGAYLDWPHVGQVLKIQRRRTVGGKTTTDIAY